MYRHEHSQEERGAFEGHRLLLPVPLSTATTKQLHLAIHTRGNGKYENTLTPDRCVRRRGRHPSVTCIHCTVLLRGTIVNI